MRCDEILGQGSGNIREGVPDDFLCVNINLSDQLGVENWLYPKSVLSLVRMKDYIYVVIDDRKVLEGISYILHIF